jgi:hypothetical protein
VLTADVLAAYESEADESGYSIEDHPHLLSATMRELFEALRKAVLALDPCL